MASSLHSNFQDLTLSMGVPEGENLPALDYHQLLFNYLRLLGFDSTTMTVKHRMKFDRDTFKFPNPKAFYHVVHFLFYQLDKPQAVETFRDVWPIIDKKQEAQFRKRVQQWLTQIQEVYFHSNSDLLELIKQHRPSAYNLFKVLFYNGFLTTRKTD